MKAILLEPTTVDTMVVQCENYTKHGIPTGWFASREFKLDDEELNFMNHLSREDQKRIWKAHFDTGRCVPCMIDEWRDSNKFPRVGLEDPASVMVLPQRKSVVEEKMAAIFEDYHPSGRAPATPRETPGVSDTSNALQKLLQLILAIERYFASLFSGKKAED
jgi:hypothetical protein